MHHPSVNRKEYSYVKGVYTNGIEGCRATVPFLLRSARFSVSLMEVNKPLR
jgi:hypothetical protein